MTSIDLEYPFNVLDSPLKVRGASSPDKELDAVKSRLQTLMGDSAMLIAVSEQCNAQVVIDMTSRSVMPPSRNRAQSPSIAAVLGRASHGLCVVLLPTEAEAKCFFADNPDLGGTLITFGPKGYAAWFKVRGEYPDTLKRQGTSWLADGSAVILNAGETLRPKFRIHKTAKPLEISFADIRWTEQMASALQVAALTARHGGPLVEIRGRMVANENFWSAVIAKKAGLRFGPNTKRFYRQDSSLLDWRPVEDYTVLREIATQLSVLGQQPADTFLMECRTQSKMQSLLESMRVTAPVHLDDLPDLLEEFVVNCLEPCLGSSVSSSELFAEHERWCRDTKRVAHPLPVFQKRIVDLVQKQFHVKKCTRIIRNGKWCRGFKHLRLKHAQVETDIDG